MRADNQRLAFNIKGFCDNCGVYKRRGLTIADFTDSTGRVHKKAFLCTDCYGEQYVDTTTDTAELLEETNELRERPA